MAADPLADGRSDCREREFPGIHIVLCCRKHGQHHRGCSGGLRKHNPVSEEQLREALRYSHSAKCGGFRRVRRGAIVSLVRASSATRARFVAAILSLALIYAFSCPATCANCLGAGAAAATESQGCGHAASGAPRGVPQQAPAKPDCFGHHRFGFDVIQTDGLSRVPLSATGHAMQLSHGAARVEVLNVDASFISDLAPPRDGAIFPQQNSSILRI
jgi:hypothetical protein